MTARDVITQALELSEKATDRWEAGAGWAYEYPTATGPAVLRNVFKAERWAELERRQEDEARVQRNIEFAVAARTLLPALAKALGDVLDASDYQVAIAKTHKHRGSCEAKVRSAFAKTLAAAITAALSEVTQ